VLEAVTRWSMARPWLIACACVWFMAWSLFFVRDLRVDFLPALAPAQASIQTEAPGLVSEQVEQLVTRPIESRLIGAAGVGAVSSQSGQGLSIVTVRFADGADPYRTLQVISQNLSAAAGALPAGVAPPRISPLTPQGAEVMKLGFTSDKLDAMSLRDVVQWTARPRLLGARGVASVSVYGGATRQIAVLARPADLADSDLGLLDILNAARRVTSVAGAGFIDTPTQRVLIEPRGQALTADDVGAGQIPAAGAAPTRIADVADVVEGPAPAFGDALIGGKPGVLVSIADRYGANPLETTRAVEQELSILRPALAAQGISITTLDRPATFAVSALGGIARDLAIGAIAIALVLLLFLRDPRAALISLAAIALSLIGAVVILEAFGLTLNVMTLGGLAIGLGVVVNDAVIDVENILTRLRDAETRHASHHEAVAAASLAVRESVIYPTLALIIVVLPLLALRGAQHALLAPLAEAAIAASLASLAVAAVVTPSLCVIFLRHIQAAPDPLALRRLKEAYGHLLGALLARPAGVLLAAGVVTVGAIGAVASFPPQFLPPVHDGHLVIEARAPPGSSLEVTRDYGVRIADDLKSISGVRTVAQRIGRDATGEDGWSASRSELDVELAPGFAAKAQQRIAERVAGVLRLYPGLATDVGSRFDSHQEDAQGAAPLEVTIFGEDLDALNAVGVRIATVLKTLPGARGVLAQSEALAPVVRIDLKFPRLALFSLSSADVLDTVQAAFAGERVARIYRGDRIVDLALSAQESLRRDPEAVGDLLLRSTSGITVPLKAVANIYLTDGQVTIDHDGGFRRQVVIAAPADAVRFETLARKAIAAQVSLPPGVFLEFGGAGRAAASANRHLLIDYGFALFGVFAVLAVALDARTSALVMLCGLFSLVGAVVAVALMGGVLSIGAIVGVIALLGISTRSSILILCGLQDLLASGEADWSPQAILRATRERFTAVLMTAVLVALALTFVALHAGETGREILGPMAIVILGGLFTSTLGVLIILPMILTLIRPLTTTRVATTQPSTPMATNHD